MPKPILDTFPGQISVVSRIGQSPTRNQIAIETETQRIVLGHLDEVDALINELIKARNQTWPWPTLQIESN